MSTELFVLIGGVFAIALGVIFGVPRWAKVTAATILFAYQVGVLLFSFDATARDVASKEMRSGSLTPEFQRGAQAMRTALVRHRLTVLVTSVGLVILVIGQGMPRKATSDPS